MLGADGTSECTCYLVLGADGTAECTCYLVLGARERQPTSEVDQLLLDIQADGEGFEPTVALRLLRFSRPVH